MSIFTLRRDAKKAINVIYSAQPDESESIKFVTKNVNRKEEVKKCRKWKPHSYTLTRNVT